MRVCLCKADPLQIFDVTRSSVAHDLDTQHARLLFSTPLVAVLLARVGGRERA